MTPAELRELLAKATPAEWAGADLPKCVVVTGTNESYFDWHPDLGVVMCRAEADARLIAALRNEAPALLDRVEALERALGWFVQFHSGHVLPPELSKAMAKSRALLRDGEGSR